VRRQMCQSLCLGKGKGPTPQKWPHQDRPDTPQPGHWEKAFIMPGGREPIHRAQDLQGGLRGGCERSRETPGCPMPGSLWHCRRARWHPTGAAQGRGRCPSPEAWHRGRQLGRDIKDPSDPSLRAGDGAAAMGVREELQHPQTPASSRSHPYPRQQQLGPVPLAGCWGRVVGDCPTAVLLWAEGHNAGPLHEDKRGPGHLPRAAGRAGMELQAELQPPQTAPAFVLEAGSSSGRTSGAGAISHPFREQLLLPPPSQSTALHCQSRHVSFRRLCSDPPTRTTQT